MKIHKLVYILMPIAVYLAFMWAPPAAILGEASRILYFHVPVAFVSVIAFVTAGVESIIIIIQKNSNSFYREEKAYNATLIGLVFSILTLITGAIWANLNWGAYWNWDPRQTSIVILLLIYIAYFSLYSALADNENRGKISSVYLILAMIVMPLFVFIIPRVYDSLHPDTLINAEKKMHLESAMRITLFVSTAAFTLLYHDEDEPGRRACREGDRSRPQDALCPRDGDQGRMKRQLAERSGRDGERRAAFWLRAKGWQILDERVKTPAGEIDLIAKRGKLVAFVEVKWRRKREELDHAIDQHRLSRVAAAAEAVAHRYAGEGEDIRVDVILLAPGAFPRHIANAWQP